MKLNVSFEFGPDDKMARPATFIGLKDKHFVIIEIAEKDKEEFVLRKLENTDVVVRGIADTELGHIVAFKSSILTTIAKPAFLLFSVYRAILPLSLCANTCVTRWRSTVC